MRQIRWVIFSFVLFAFVNRAAAGNEYGPLSSSFVPSFSSVSREIVLSIGDLRRGYESEFDGSQDHLNWMLTSGQNRLQNVESMIRENGLPVSSPAENELNQKLRGAVSNLLIGADQISHHQKRGAASWKEGCRLFLEACDVVLQSKIPAEAKAELQWTLSTESFTLRGEPYTGATMADFSGQYHYILCVVPDSPADEVGIHSGDILHEFGASHIVKPYKSQTWYVIRNGKEGIVSLTPILY